MRKRPKLSYSNVISTLALFIALGGVAVAAQLPKGSVGPKQLKIGAVHAKNIATGSITAGKIGPGAVTGAKLATGSVDADKIANGVIISKNVASNAIDAGKLRNGSISSAKIGDGQVTTLTIGDGQVTGAKIAANAIGGTQINPAALPLLGTLKSGQTLRGAFALGDVASISGDVNRNAISFPFPLTNAPAINVLDARTTLVPTGACPGLSGGNGQTPDAAAGNLCIYLVNGTNLDTVNPLTVPVATISRLGAGLEIKSQGAGAFNGYGLWALTAP